MGIFNIGESKDKEVKESDRTEKLSGKEKKAILQDINDRQETVKGQGKTDSTAFEDAWKQFSGRGIKKLHIPKTFLQAWMYLSKAIHVFLTKGDLFNASPRGKDDRKKNQILSAGLNHAIYTIPSFEMSFIKNTMQALIYGWTVFKTGWEVGNYREGLIFPFISNSDITWDSTANLSCEIQWFHQKIIMNKKELEKKRDTKRWFPNEVDAFLKVAEDYKKEKGSKLNEELKNPYENKFEIREAWTLEKRYFVGICDNEATHVLFSIENQYHRFPYEIGTIAPDLDGLRGFGIPEGLKNLQVEGNYLERLKMQAIDIAVKGLYQYTQGAGGVGEGTIRQLLESKPPAVIPFRQGTELSRLDTGHVPIELFREGDIMAEHTKDVWSAYDPMTGKPTQRKETLGGLNLMTEKGNERQLAHFHIFALALASMGKWMLQYLVDNQTKEDFVKVWDVEKRVSGWEAVNYKNILKKKDVEGIDVFNDTDLILTTNFSPTKALDDMSFFKLIELLQNEQFANLGVDFEEVGKEAADILKPGWGERIFKGEGQKTINMLRELDLLKQLGQLPPNDIPAIINLGIQALQQQDSQRMQGTGGIGER